MEAKRRSTMQAQTYRIEGNTVRKQAPAQKEEGKKQRRQYTEEDKRRAQSRRRAQRNRERALYMNPAYLAFLTVCVLLTFVICGCYIHLQSKITTSLNTISSLESQIEDLQSDNEEALQSIETSVDLDTIKSRAEGLGMVYPNSSQITYYNMQEEDGMTQYSTTAEDNTSILSSLFK
jgi:cell division protein FtsL